MHKQIMFGEGRRKTKKRKTIQTSNITFSYNYTPGLSSTSYECELV